MTDLLQPFVGFIADSKFAPRVVGPPRSTLTADQKAAASDDSLSFRYIAGRKAHRPSDEALQWIDELCSRGVLIEIGPAVVVYRQEKNGFEATGVIGDLSLEAYEAGRVKRHERTIAKTQARMTEYMRTTRIYGNPPVNAFQPNTIVEQAVAAHTVRDPNTEFGTVDGIHHTLWVVSGQEADDLCHQITSDLYITDGHHRLAAASLAASQEGRKDARMPAGVFSANQFSLKSFARCIFDPGLDPARAIRDLEGRLEVEQVPPDQAKPRSRFELGAKVGDKFFLMRIPAERIPGDHYDSLNTNLLTELVLKPVFGIVNPRLDRRLKFVADLGSIHEQAPDADAWFLPYPLQAADVIKVADSNQTMPAKSTWFAPKLPSGLVIRPIDGP